MREEDSYQIPRELSLYASIKCQTGNQRSLLAALSLAADPSEMKIASSGSYTSCHCNLSAHNQ